MQRLCHEAWTLATPEEKKPSKGSHISREIVSNILVRRPPFTKDATNERHVGKFEAKEALNENKKSFD